MFIQSNECVLLITIFPINLYWWRSLDHLILISSRKTQYDQNVYNSISVVLISILIKSIVKKLLKHLLTLSNLSLIAWNFKAHPSQKAIIGLYVPRGINSIFPVTHSFFGIHLNIFFFFTPLSRTKRYFTFHFLCISNFSYLYCVHYQFVPLDLIALGIRTGWTDWVRFSAKKGGSFILHSVHTGSVAQAASWFYICNKRFVNCDLNSYCLASVNRRLGRMSVSYSPFQNAVSYKGTPAAFMNPCLRL